MPNRRQQRGRESDVTWGSLPLLLLTMGAAAVSCTALGIAHAAIALRVRELAVFSNVVFALLFEHVARRQATLELA